MQPFRPHHTLQLFDSTQSRAKAVSEYVTRAVNAGATVLVVATSRTRSMLLEELRRSGIDVDRLIDENRIRVLNAPKTVDALLRRDWPEPALLDATLGIVIAELAGGSAPLFVYDEMADILAERGLHRAARRLEQLWNALVTRDQFELLCGYTSGHFGNERTADILEAIRSQHSDVVVRDEDMLGKFLLIRSGSKRD
jgi:hypothetical protein